MSCTKGISSPTETLEKGKTEVPIAYFCAAPSIKSGFGSYNGTAIGAAFDTDDSTGITTLRCNSVSQSP